MNYLVTHKTKYRYSTPVSVCHNVLMLEPANSALLTCSEYSLEIEPEPTITMRRIDMFGNVVQRFSLEENHETLSITSKSQVISHGQLEASADLAPTCQQISTEGRELTDPNWLTVAPFFFESPRIKFSPQFAAYGAESMKMERSIVAGAMDLTHRIFTDFKYDTDATAVDTATAVAFDGKHGVCQDFAHVAVACLRSCGLPARYVSGYLRTRPPEGKERLIGADESHAWFSVYCGSQLGWIDFDPTNDCLCGVDHVPIAFGRDYSDVVPVKGIFLGGGKTSLTVSVDVAPV